MSHIPLPTSAIPHEVILHPRLTSAAVRLYCVLAAYGAAKEPVDITHRELAAGLNLSPKSLTQVQVHLRRLRDAGYLQVTPQASEAGAVLPSMYYLVPLS